MAKKTESASPRIGIYLRVSSKTQDAASQEPDLRRWLAAHEDEGAVWYRDKFTGKTLDRPGCNRMLADIRAGKIDTVVVWRLDRLGRTARGLTELFEEFAARKTNLISLRDGLDLKTPAGRLMANVLASVAQYETEVRAERVLAGLAVAREKGVRLGRPAGIHTRVKVTDEQATMARRLKAEGQGVSGISRATGLSRPTVYGLLAAPA